MPDSPGVLPGGEDVRVPKSFGEVRRRLGEEGFSVARQKGSHQKTHQDGRRVTVAGKNSASVLQVPLRRFAGRLD